MCQPLPPSIRRVAGEAAIKDAASPRAANRFCSPSSMSHRMQSFRQSVRPPPTLTFCEGPLDKNNRFGVYGKYSFCFVGWQMFRVPAWCISKVACWSDTGIFQAHKVTRPTDGSILLNF